MPEITSKTQLPGMPYFVLRNDLSMSGWGPATGKINTIILPCRTMSEAVAVKAHAINRGDMSYIRIVAGKPSIHPARVYYSLHDWTDYRTWYTGYVSVKRHNEGEGLYSFSVHFKGYAYDRLGYSFWSCGSLWEAFETAMKISHRAGYRIVKFDWSGYSPDLSFED